MKKILSLTFCVALCGCAYFHSTTYTYDPTSGKQVGETHMTGYAMLDSNGQISKASNRSATVTTNGMWAPGTYIGEANGSASSSNAVLIINGAGAIISKIPF